MNKLEMKKSELKDKLKELKTEKLQMDERMARILCEIKDKVALHNQLVGSVASMKKDYKDGIQQFSLLKSLLKQYKEEQRGVLRQEYAKQITNSINELNSIRFDLKLSVFKKFDQIKAIKSESFPILSSKKAKFFNHHKSMLKQQVLNEIRQAQSDQSKINGLVFYINFSIRYEIYFVESIFTEFLDKLIEKSFEYHFLSDRESNRLDKPEWFFDFLLGKYEEIRHLFTIYSDCNIKLGLERRSIVELIDSTQNLVYLKINEMLKSRSSQKRNLVLHFAKQYKEYASNLEKVYGFNANITEISHLLSKTQADYISRELTRIHELRYVQWFGEYKRLCKESMAYIQNFRSLDRNFKLSDLIHPILLHTRAFLENLRFINRDEIKVIGFVFSELEELKNFITNEESEMLLASTNQELDDIATKSLEKITKINVEILQLIKSLAMNDIQLIMKKIQYFNYTSTESKRVFVVDLNRILDEYKHCIYFEIIEKTILEKVDSFILNDILLKIRFTPDEYLEFRNFYKTLKNCFKVSEWKSDRGCKSIDAIFEGKTLSGSLFKTINEMYMK